MIDQFTAKRGAAPRLALDWIATLNDSNQDRNDCKHQQDMDEPTESVGTHQTQQPQNQQYDRNCPEHAFSLSVFRLDCSDKPKQEEKNRL